ncbi:MAG: hypothetical protein L0Y71_20540 [Gemmataceae bacterium]|nr:hypothetical protein [Gemmataceae bacterium]
MPTGTIYQTDFDALGRVTAEKVGASDANLVQTAGYVYDAAGIGDSNLTEATARRRGESRLEVLLRWAQPPGRRQVNVGGEGGIGLLPFLDRGFPV